MARKKQSYSIQPTDPAGDGPRSQPDIKQRTSDAQAPDPAPDPAASEASNTAYAQAGRARATTRQVDPRELSTYQLNQMLAQDSPLRKRAMQEGIDYAASRGLANSSIAGGNAVGAFIDRAKDFATFDASAYQTAARDNQTAQNQIGLFNAEQQGQASQFNANADNAWRDRQWQSGENALDRQWKTDERIGDQQFQQLMQANDQEFKQGLADLDAQLQREGYDVQERTAMLEAITQARTDEAQILAQGALAIYQNPKLKAGQQNEAFMNLKNTTHNQIFNELVANYPDLPDLFPDLFG